MNKIRLVMTLTLLFFTLMFGNACGDSNDAPKKQRLCVMVIMDRVDIDDFYACPNILKLIEGNGSLALMNTNTGGRYEPEGAYLTMGAGIRASAAGLGRQSMDYTEDYEGYLAGDIFKALTDENPSRDNLLVMDIPSIIIENNKLDRKIIPGLLGEELKKHLIPVTCLGNADSTTKKNRLVATIAMDSKGIVQQGSVGAKLNVDDITSPFLIKTDYGELYREYLHYKTKGGLVIIQMGDLVRAYNTAGFIDNSLYEKYRFKALSKADEFVGRIVKDLDLEDDLLMLTVPFPSFEGYQSKKLLTPFLISGPGYDRGLAISPTTRRPGLVANTDIAPTVLSHFGIPAHPSTEGSIITYSAAKDGLLTLTKMQHRITNTYIQRAYIIKPYIGMLIITSLGFLLCVFLKPGKLGTIKPLILSNMAVPLALLLLPIVGTTVLTWKYIWLFLMTVTFVAISLKFKSALGSISFICLLTAAALLADLYFGAPLMKESILGYDPIVGARYYGIGNEYMGVLIGAVTVGTTCLLDMDFFANHLRPLIRIGLVGGIYLLTVFMIASPYYGSNFGGTLSAYIASFVTLTLLTGVATKRKMIIPAFLGMTTMVFAFLLLMASKGPPTHISQAFASVKDRGMNSIYPIIERKLRMNIKLFKYTPWTRALLTTIGVSIALFFYPLNILKRIFIKYPYIHKGFLGAGIGCLTALLANDSGIVAAATMMIYIALPLFLLVESDFNNYP